VAQPGSALALGARSRRFESGRPDLLAQMRRRSRRIAQIPEGSGADAPAEPADRADSSGADAPAEPADRADP
jgi:hypothetical protein